MPEKCVRDYHLFTPDAPAQHEVKRIYQDGSFHIFYVCSTCLPAIHEEASRYGIEIKVVPVESLPTREQL